MNILGQDIVDRNTTLNMGENPSLQYLSVEAFHMYFDNTHNGKNTLNLYGSPLGYYKENQWLFDYKTELNLTDKLLYVNTTDGQDFWSTQYNEYTLEPNNTTPVMTYHD